MKTHQNSEDCAPDETPGKGVEGLYPTKHRNSTAQAQHTPGLHWVSGFRAFRAVGSDTKR